ncbi:MAG: aspartate--tRNA ligase, partial [Deltaproteobacteria bacterium]|nr:aspartate--tRNA ligase [Deltaproteobacteria bacterium]
MREGLGNWKRDFYCAQTKEAHIGSTVTLMGWAQKRRDHGGLIFIDLRDRTGLVQLVFNPEKVIAAHAKAHDIRSEFVLAIKGVVQKRPSGTENPALKTGTIEVSVNELRVLNDSAPLPFMIEDETDVAEMTRLKYRYLDLRRPVLQEKLVLRHRAAMAARNFLSENGFIEIETPVLTKSTPEGARDFLVPSRLNAGEFFALPQSPQLFKQILMIAGFDKYFQIVKCFRDEDLRADRQPEFTQIDAEMSFVERDDVIAVMEGLVSVIFKEGGVDVSPPFPRLTYAEAVGRFGLDSPDTRFGMELVDLTDSLKGSGFKVFSQATKAGVVKALCVKGGAEFSRKDLDDLTETAVSFGAKGLAWVKLTPDGWQSPIAKFLSDNEKTSISTALSGAPGDLLLFAADKPVVANTVLGRLRLNIGNRLGLIPKDKLNFVWVTEFPMLDYDAAEKRFVAVHHPFTAPMDADLDKLDTDPLKVRAQAYDLVLNGVEIGGGSIRIHRSDIQSKIFSMLGITEEDAAARFGFLLEALKFGAPPHGGIALGLDRILAIMTGSESIRDVIAFPKTQKAADAMCDAPSVVDAKQL